MREIKFRAWNKSGEEMIPPMDIQNMIHQKVSTISLKMLYDDIEFLQFTGLLDKNGKEIYEGDIVKLGKKWQEVPGFLSISQGDGKGYGEIKYNYTSFWINFGYSPNELGSQIRLDAYEAEVMGNIYENPELLAKVENGV